MLKLSYVLAGWMFLLVPAVSHAFDGHRVSEGPLTVEIQDLPKIRNHETPHEVRVTLSNASMQTLDVEVSLVRLVDEWRAVGKSAQRVNLSAKGNTTISFRIAAGRECHSALYPVHVSARFESTGQTRFAHAVRIFETEFASTPIPSEGAARIVHRVPTLGALPLASVDTHHISWSYYDQPQNLLPVGWEGSEPTSRASFSRGTVSRGTDRNALQMHPPYIPGGGTIFANYRIQLPKTRPLTLAFSNAIRDHSASEPPSDGVTFRVWADDQQLFERHTDSKTWVAGEVDLSEYSGSEILLRLESHPGPQQNTTCDSCYWGDPIVVAGPIVQPMAEMAKKHLRRQAQAALGGVGKLGDQVFAFDLGSDCRAAIALGQNGLADAAVSFGSPDQSVTFDGLRVAIEDSRVGQWPTALVTKNVRSELDAAGRLRITHELLMDDELFPLQVQVWAESPGLRIKVDCPRRITDLAFGPADSHAPRVYYGHGFCLVEPGTFRAGGGGHNLAASHVGFDFGSGVSLLMACDTPPDHLQVTPDQKLYTLHAHPDTTFTCVPGLQGAMDCAFRYRPLYDKAPSAGVATKAGRFCFDIWGGRYAENAQILKKAFQYGLTDSIAIMHVWQRGGYDYRLPDIFPPNSDLGTLADLQELAKTCDEYKVLWGLHDNYIDFYPDADEYSYEHIVFTADGRPQKAWINTGRDAQSFRFRPDRIQPFVERNLELITAEVPMTAYFIDVFTSINCFDFYDRQGTFHSKMETQRAWGEAFDWIRHRLGGKAPMVSEAGSDQLIGYVDGADCQFLQISAEPQQFRLAVPCEDWERVPWFDAVNHARFSLHGVGYSGRYQGGRSRESHGIESDDYLSAEVLTGHALMIDRTGMIFGAVRKYWLAQELVGRLATDEIVGFEFADGDIHRAIVRWKSGLRVHVNRGSTDWRVAGHTLPQYGFLAQGGDLVASIERIDDQVVEYSQSKRGFYANARGFRPNAPLLIRPTATRATYLGGRRFKLYIDWNAREAAPKNLAVFMHFFQPQVSRLELTGFYGGGGMPSLPTSRWSGRVITGDRWEMTLPEDCPPGNYEVLVGLYDRSGDGRRYRLLGDQDSERRYRVGTLVVEGHGNQVSRISLKPNQGAAALDSRLAATESPIDFGPATTTGGFRCQVRRDRLIVTPLPGSDAFPIALNLPVIFAGRVAFNDAFAADADGQRTRDIDFHADGSQLRFSTKKGEFAYHLVFGDE